MPSDHDIDDLERIPINVPYDLDRQMGYDNATGLSAGCNGVHIGMWIGIDGSVVVSDGYSTKGGNTGRFNQWDLDAGIQLLKEVAKESDEHTLDDVPEGAAAPRLTTIFGDAGYDLGSPRSPGDSAFLLDTQAHTLYIGEREMVRELCWETNDPPEIVDALTDDTQEAVKIFEEAINEFDSDRFE